MRWSEPALLLAAAFAISCFATAWARAHARSRGLMDLPGERRSHDLPTPRGGGIGIALAGLCACGWLAWVGSGAWIWVAVGLALVAGAGWWDDHRPLPAWPRLLAHLVAGASLSAGMLQLGAPAAAVFAATARGPVLGDGWDFIAGVAGRAPSQALLAALAFAWVLDGPGRVLALVVAAACCGFLPFNLPKARIFLGDVGSGALGYLLAALVVLGFSGLSAEWWPILLLPLASCLVDAGMTLAGRMFRGEAWWQPHVQHLYQRLARSHGHPRVTLGYAGWTALSIGIMLGLYRAPEGWARVGTAIFFGLSIVAWRGLHRRLGNASEGTV